MSQIRKKRPKMNKIKRKEKAKKMAKMERKD